MHAFVTGGTGRLGRVLVAELLQRGHEVRMLVRKDDEVPKGALAAFGDLSSTSAIETGLKGTDVVFHLAAIIDPSAQWERLNDVNVKGTRALVELCSKLPLRRFVFFSSTSVYGRQPTEIPAKESTPTSPTDPYGRSKLEAESVLGEYFGAVPITVLRPSVIYGPTFLQTYARVLRRLEQGKMQILGNGKNVVPFVHANDVVDAAFKATETDFAVGKTYLISENTTITQEQIYSIACDALSVPFVKQYANPSITKAFISISSLLRSGAFGPEDIEVLSAHRVFDTSRAERELKWSPKIKLTEGIRQMVELYRTKIKR